MPLDIQQKGKTYGPYQYEIGLEKMREFAAVVAGASPSLGQPELPKHLNPILYDEEAAKKGPYGGLIAFPMFAVTFAIAPFAAAVKDPAVGCNLLLLVHGEQEFEFFEVMRPGDKITTTGTILEIFEKANMDFLIVRTDSVNQHGRPVVRGTWTAVIRRG
jgi:acyl dehydratase